MGIETLEFFVPTNRVSKNGRKRGLDGLNEIVRQCRGNRVIAAKRKIENETWVARFASEAMQDSGWSARDCLNTVILTFIEPDTRRDDDNVFGAAKFILDALCEPSGRNHLHGCGAIVDDDPFHCALIPRRGDPDRENPGVRVKIIREEAQDGGAVR